MVMDEFYIRLEDSDILISGDRIEGQLISGKTNHPVGFSIDNNSGYIGETVLTVKQSKHLTNVSVFRRFYKSDLLPRSLAEFV